MVVVVPDSEYMTELLREGTPNESLHGGQQPEPAVPVRLSLECVLFRGIKKVGVISRRMPGEYAYVDVTVCLRCRELMFLVYEPGTCRFFPTFYAAKSRQALVRDFREMNTEAVSIQISVMLSELVLVDDPTKTTDAVVCAFGDSLAADMAAHPDLFIPHEKECHFFTAHADDASWYSRKFSGAKDHQICGDCTPYYLFHPFAAKWMQELTPGAKIIVLLRNPVDRAISHFWHARQRHLEELPSFQKALDAEERRLRDADDDLGIRGLTHYSHQKHRCVYVLARCTIFSF